MASNTREETSIKYLTPKFSCKWAKLDKPDTKFNPDGLYSVTAVVDPKEQEAADFLAKLDEMGVKALEAAKTKIAEEKNPGKRKQKLESLVLNPPYEAEYTEDGEETGMVVFKLKSYATRKDKDGNVSEKKIPMCDAHRLPLDPSSVQIGNGSTLRIRGTANLNYVPAQNKAFVTLYIGAVQLIDLIEFNGSGFDEFEEEDGYNAEGTSETTRGKENTEFNPEGVGGENGDF